MARTFSTMVRVGILVLFLILEEKLSGFHVEHDVSLGLSYTYSLYYVEVCSFYTQFVEVLVLTFVKSFLRHENPKSTSCVANLQSRWSRLEPLEDGRLQEEGFKGENGNLMKQAVCWRFLEKLKKGLLETLS